MIVDRRHTFDYKDYPNCFLVWDRYKMGGGIALHIHDVEGPIATATVNIPEYRLKHNEVCIKNWSENEGCLEELERLGFVERTGVTVPTGYVQSPVVKLLVDPPFDDLPEQPEQQEA